MTLTIKKNYFDKLTLIYPEKEIQYSTHYI